MAGATYSVNIELNHQSLNKQLGELDTKVKTIGKSAANKAASSKEEEKTLGKSLKVSRQMAESIDM